MNPGKIDSGKFRKKDLISLGATIVGYGIGMALAAGLALIGRDKALPEDKKKTLPGDNE